MRSIVKRPTAEQDLRDIWKYIARDSDTAATSVLLAIDAKLALLVENPSIGRERGEISLGLRSFTVGSYALYYLPSADGIEVVRVLHGARNLAIAAFD